MPATSFSARFPFPSVTLHSTILSVNHPPHSDVIFTNTIATMSREISGRYETFRVIFPTGRFEVGWLTLALLVGSLAVTLLTSFGTDPIWTNVFSITRYRIIDGHFGWKSGLPEVCHGELWRLFTPFFIHFGWGHLVFNSIWICMFGTLVEKRQGVLVFASLVLGVEAFSSLMQYAVRGPAFGGMSGVMCGLLGYIWMRDLLDPGAGLRLDRLVLIWAVLFCVASCFGFFGTAGQIAHASGFVIGLVIGITTGLFAKTKSKQ